MKFTIPRKGEGAPLDPDQADIDGLRLLIADYRAAEIASQFPKSEFHQRWEDARDDVLMDFMGLTADISAKMKRLGIPQSFLDGIAAWHGWIGSGASSAKGTTTRSRDFPARIELPGFIVHFAGVENSLYSLSEGASLADVERNFLSVSSILNNALLAADGVSPSFETNARLSFDAIPHLCAQHVVDQGWNIVACHKMSDVLPHMEHTNLYSRCIESEGIKAIILPELVESSRGFEPNYDAKFVLWYELSRALSRSFRTDDTPALHESAEFREAWQRDCEAVRSLISRGVVFDEAAIAQLSALTDPQSGPEEVMARSGLQIISGKTVDPLIPHYFSNALVTAFAFLNDRGLLKPLPEIEDVSRRASERGASSSHAETAQALSQPVAWRGDSFPKPNAARRLWWALTDLLKGQKKPKGFLVATINDNPDRPTLDDTRTQENHAVPN